MAYINGLSYSVTRWDGGESGLDSWTMSWYSNLRRSRFRKWDLIVNYYPWRWLSEVRVRWLGNDGDDGGNTQYFVHLELPANE